MDTLEKPSESLQRAEAEFDLQKLANLEKQQAALEKLINDSYRFLIPDEELTVSEWAEKKRYMSSEETSRPGPWRNEMVPYLKSIMDCLNSDTVEKITFLKPTQIGGTECGINILGYIISEKPSRILYVLPDDDALKEFSQDRFQKVLNSNDCFRGKYQDTDSKNTMLRFVGGFCKFGSANSPTDLASWSVPIVVMDEIDKYPKKSKKEASPLKLAEERTKNWPGKRKLFFWSTPTLVSGHIYQLYQKADVRYLFNVPCPFCGQMQPLKWENVKFDATKNADYVEKNTHYECEHCHEAITDAYKPAMLQKGEWIAEEPYDGTPKSVAYKLNSLYSPWVTFGRMAAEFLKSKNDPLELMNFVNSWLGEPWEPKSAVMDADLILQRKTDCPMFVVPKDAQLLTGGVDVQKGHMYWEITAWSPGTTGQVLGYGRVTTWEEIESVMDQIWPGENPDYQYQVCVYGIDTGYRTEEVYDYCWRHQGRAFPVKGSSTQMAAYLRAANIEPRSAGKLPLQLWMVNTDQYKNDIASRLELPMGRGAWMLNADCTKEFAEHITSEHRIIDEKGRERWVKKTSAKQNHWLDCCVYSFAVADLVNMRSMPEVLIPQADEYRMNQDGALPEPGFTI